MREWQGPAVVVGQDGQYVLLRHQSAYVRRHPCRLQLLDNFPDELEQNMPITSQLSENNNNIIDEKLIVIESDIQDDIVTRPSSTRTIPNNEVEEDRNPREQHDEEDKNPRRQHDNQPGIDKEIKFIEATNRKEPEQVEFVQDMPCEMFTSQELKTHMKDQTKAAKEKELESWKINKVIDLVIIFCTYICLFIAKIIGSENKNELDVRENCISKNNNEVENLSAKLSGITRPRRNTFCNSNILCPVNDLDSISIVNEGASLEELIAYLKDSQDLNKKLVIVSGGIVDITKQGYGIDYSSDVQTTRSHKRRKRLSC